MWITNRLRDSDSCSASKCNVGQSETYRLSPVMAVDDTLKNIFDELASLKAYADASYRRGYRDGIAKAVQILSVELENLDTSPDERLTRYHACRVKARRGSVPSRILDALQERDGATYQEIVQTLARRGTPTSVQSIRSAMRRLLQGNIVKGHDNRWFLVQASLGKAEPNERGLVEAPANEASVGAHDFAVEQGHDLPGVKG